MRPDTAALLRPLAPALAAALTVACAAPVPLPAPAPPPPTILVVPAPSPPAPPPAPAPAEPAPSSAVTSLLAYADQVRTLPPPAIATELSRLSSQPVTPMQQFQLALVLMQTRAAGELGRAGQLLQRIQADESPDARVLHSLARQVAAQLADQRRLEEQVERQGQQLRDAQRRADVLQDRLEALRAIERARPNRAAPP